MNFVFGNRSMFYPPWYDEELAVFQPDITLSALHPEPPFDHQEAFVFMVVVEPHELALKLDQFDVLPVRLANDLGAPVIMDERELLPKVYLVLDTFAWNSFASIPAPPIAARSGGTHRCRASSENSRSLE